MVMKSAKVSELKARLSSYLRDVKNGETIVVCDRLTPIARLAPIESQGEGLSLVEPRRAGRGRKKVKPVRLRKKVDLVELLRESRDQR
jgi:prevent-host-death family protein